MTIRTPLTETADRPLERVLARLSAKAYSRGYLARCPAHGDRHPSLMVWEDPTDEHVGLKCLTGCTRKAIVEAMGLTESDLYMQSKPRALRPLQPGITMIDLAVDKLIHPHLLDQLGIADITYKGRQAVQIPYHQVDGIASPRFRIRTALAAKEGSAWSPGKDSLLPYGLHRLQEARTAGYLVIVEGESDCWTLWQRQFPALGLPGAALYNALELEMLSDIERVYVLQEPDKAGNQLPANVVKRFQHLGYKGRVYALNLMEEAGTKDPNDLHKRDCKGFKATFETLLGRARPLFTPGTSGQKRPKTITLTALLQKELPPVKWAIPGILPEGLTLLCGKPKMGKSWLVLGFALAIACGGHVLGRVQVEQGQVLYLDLEDNERRLQRRAKQALHDLHITPDAVHIALSWPRLDKGGIDHLETWLTEHPETRLVIVDTWTKLAPRLQGQKRTQYEEEYDALTPLKELADRRTISILAVTHLRKMLADDVLDEISGTTGLTGAVDGFLVLKRERGQQIAALHVIGRDIEEEQALALSFDPASATWILEGKVEDVQKKHVTKERQALFDLLSDHAHGLSAQEVTDTLGKNFYTVRNLLRSMVHEGMITAKKGIFTLGQEDGQSVQSDPMEMDTFAKSDDLHGSCSSHGSFDSDESMNEPVEGDKENHNEKYTHGSSRGSCGSHGSFQQSDVLRYDSIDRSQKNHENHKNHEKNQTCGSVSKPPVADDDEAENHENYKNHANHTFLSDSSSQQKDKEGWEVFYL